MTRLAVPMGCDFEQEYDKRDAASGIALITRGHRDHPAGSVGCSRIARGYGDHRGASKGMEADFLSSGVGVRDRNPWEREFQISDTRSGTISNAHAPSGSRPPASQRRDANSPCDHSSTGNRRRYVKHAGRSTTWRQRVRSILRCASPAQRRSIEPGGSSSARGAARPSPYSFSLQRSTGPSAIFVVGGQKQAAVRSRVSPPLRQRRAACCRSGSHDRPFGVEGSVPGSDVLKARESADDRLLHACIR